MLQHISEKKKKKEKTIECDNALFLPDHTYIAILYPYQLINGDYLYSQIKNCQELFKNMLKLT